MMQSMSPAASRDAAGIDALLAPCADALFWRPTRLGVSSAWYGHVPFAHWLVSTVRPASIVELGTQSGVSYAAFCEAVQRGGLDTRCLAVDTWRGDEHAGFYGDDIFADLVAFHDARYGGFSQLVRMTFDEALPFVADASVDLLHIDGRHRYEDVLHDFTVWRPKLSPRAMVLFHDTNERSSDFGVWRMWNELTEVYSHFEFLHEHGLGVLCAGPQPPPGMAALCSLGAADTARVRERFALLGERWMAVRNEQRLSRALDTERAHSAHLESQFAELTRYVESTRGNEPPPERGELRRALAQAFAAEQQSVRDRAQITGAVSQASDAASQASEATARVSQAMVELRDALAALAHGRAESERLRHLVQQAAAHAALAREQARAHEAALQRLLSSRSWRLATRFRDIWHALHPVSPAGDATAFDPWPVLDAEPALPPPEDVPDLTPPVVVEAPAFSLPEEAAREPEPEPVAKTPGRALFAAGEPGTPGELYRCQRQMEAARAAGWEVRTKPSEELNPDDLRATDLVVLWRVTWSRHIEGVIEHVRMFGGRVALDLDDLMIRTDLAKIEFIDAIRSINWSEGHVRNMFLSVTHVLHNVDFCIATTEELAAEMRKWQKAAYVLPNCFDAQARERSFVAARRKAVTRDRLIRIGYATGSRTHHRDFAEAADGVAAALRARPDARLVLFQSREDGQPLLSPDEFPSLAGLADQIEWRDLVPLEDLPDELARFDINLVPLQLNNPFVEAKSELKFFEAALAGVPTVASPTGPYRRAIIDGQTGLLAASPGDWEHALLRLIDDAELRQRLARAAAASVLWRHGPEGNARRMGRFLSQHRGGRSIRDGRALADAFALDVAAAHGDAAPAPLTPADILFHHDALGHAELTVAIASFNYADYIQQALESVRLQTLEMIDLIVADDYSSDPATMTQILDWAHACAPRFNRLLVLRHRANAGLGATRNTSFAHATTPFVLPLDADNRLLPGCAARLLEALRDTDAAYAYPRLRHFGESTEVTGGMRYEPQRLAGGNYIDAMALVARWAWSAAGGYYVQRDAMGWEDYALWCRLAELGEWGLAVDEELAEYRVHTNSMVNAITETHDNKDAMIALLERRHPWLRIIARTPYARQSSVPSPA